MSSTVSRLNKARLPILALGCVASIAVAQNAAPVRTPGEVVQPIPPGASTALPQGSADWNRATAQLTRTADSGVLATVAQWKSLQQSDGLGFAAYAPFLLAHSGWPGEDRMRRLAETSINPNSFAPVQVTEFFAKYPPRTATGYARYALALSALGRMGEAQVQAKSAWRNGTLSPSDEAQLLGMFSGSFLPLDHLARADALLWQGNNAAAERVLPSVPDAQRPVIDARIAMQRNAADAATKMQMAEPYAVGDPGYLVDKVNWLRTNGNAVAARGVLANRHTLATRPFNAERWFEILLSSARASVSDGDYAQAYAIASKVDDAYDPNTDVSNRPLGERDDYTSLTWLAGTTAYYNTGRARDAVGMFARYATAARSPQTISKGYYWAGRAALLAGDTSLANRYFASAGSYPDQFHGQLALERLGKPVPAPVAFAQALPAPTEVERQEFQNRSVVRAAKALGAAGQWQDQTLFLRAIAASVSTDKERALAIELARTIGRPDLGVMVGRRALANGQSGYNEASFPSVTVPDAQQMNWTMIHAISRQESQFDRAAVSRAGARGLMQLMPGTARETAGKVGLAYTLDSLTGDPQYNIQLGGTYFQQLLGYYGGSYPLAIAAYNAGPGNVNKWLRANGDPRLPGGDMVRWIESIPIQETRNYVQRVLENAVVYDAMRPEIARFRGSLKPLSNYLGKNDAG